MTYPGPKEKLIWCKRGFPPSPSDRFSPIPDLKIFEVGGTWGALTQHSKDMSTLPPFPWPSVPATAAQRAPGLKPCLHQMGGADHWPWLGLQGSALSSSDAEPGLLRFWNIIYLHCLYCCSWPLHPNQLVAPGRMPLVLSASAAHDQSSWHVLPLFSSPCLWLVDPFQFPSRLPRRPLSLPSPFLSQTISCLWPKKWIRSLYKLVPNWMHVSVL